MVLRDTWYVGTGCSTTGATDVETPWRTVVVGVLLSASVVATRVGVLAAVVLGAKPDDVGWLGSRMAADVLRTATPALRPA